MTWWIPYVLAVFMTWWIPYVLAVFPIHFPQPQLYPLCAYNFYFYIYPLWSYISVNNDSSSYMLDYFDHFWASQNFTLETWNIVCFILFFSAQQPHLTAEKTGVMELLEVGVLNVKWKLLALNPSLIHSILFLFNANSSCQLML